MTKDQTNNPNKLKISERIIEKQLFDDDVLEMITITIDRS